MRLVGLVDRRRQHQLVLTREAHDRRAHPGVRTQLHDELEGETVVRTTEERQEEVHTAASARCARRHTWDIARRMLVDEQCNVGMAPRKDAPHEV